MGQFRALVNITLSDGRKVSPTTGVFELSDVEAYKLEKWWIAPAVQPLSPGVADQIIEQQAKEIDGLKKQLLDKDAVILDLQGIIGSKEADIDLLNKSLGAAKIATVKK